VDALAHCQTRCSGCGRPCASGAAPNGRVRCGRWYVGIGGVVGEQAFFLRRHARSLRPTNCSLRDSFSASVSVRLTRIGARIRR